jgi:cellobiose phosphorylase
MTSTASACPVRVLSQAGGQLQPRLHARLQARLQPHGGLERLRCGGLSVNLFPASAMEAGLANVWLRCHEADGSLCPVPLLGPAAPGRQQTHAGRVWQQGAWRGLHYRLELVLAAAADAWFWHLQLRNTGPQALRLDLVYLQDVALAPWDAVRLNEAYVSQYLDHQPLQHATHGVLLATRQNQPVAGRVPWLLSGSLGRADAYATDALQVLGRAARGGQRHGLLHQPLPNRRLQHEHALVALQEAAFTLAPGASAQHGFFGWLEADHPGASGAADLQRLPQVLALPEAQPPAWADASDGSPAPADPRTLFSQAPLWPSETPDHAALTAWFGAGWRHLDHGPQGELLSYFQGGAAAGGSDGECAAAHVVTRAKDLQVLRPHGHLLRSGSHWTPDEQALASTVWMAGVFHSSLTQGHASANRCLSTQRGYLGVFRALGLRVFVDAGSGWQLLDLPSAWRLTPTSATWVYQAGGQRLQVVADAAPDAPVVGLRLQVQDGPPLALLLALHLAFNHADGHDDGLSAAPVSCTDLHPPVGVDLRLQPAAGSQMDERFPGGGLRLQAAAGDATLRVLGDEALFLDGRSRRLPWLCLQAAGVQQLDLLLAGELVPASVDAALPVLGGGAQPPALHWSVPAGAGSAGQALGQLADWLPWLAHNALVHYLVPRGLEQFSGGGWGTRDVCQGPAELLLALGRHDALRDLLCRVFSAQNADGDWPQWFMFYPRDAHIRAGDSHGDIVFWPLVALADYLVASGDATLLDQALPFHGSSQAWPLSEHLARALALVQRRTIAGTRLAAYGHGDWNDALQPADPAMREHLCSAWTVTLHHRMLRGLAAAWQRLGRDADASAASAQARAVADDFQRLLLVDGVLTGYASFSGGAVSGLLLHPRDARTGIHHSALAMVHAIADELFSPAQAQAHAALIERALLGPDGLRLFDRPLRYTGGTMALFQRGESAAYFGREIGLMYTHAHLRWAEALARLGRGDALLHALRLANPIGLQALLPQAAPRQHNCYFSSSDAAFADRDDASLHYGRIASGAVALEGGWRIYSSGAGIAYRLVLQHLLGLVQQQHRLGIDPVLPTALDGLVLQLPLYGHPVRVRYQVGPRGHGPQSVLLDGQPLLLQPGRNRYRSPGMWTAAGPLRQRLAQGARELCIQLG